MQDLAATGVTAMINEGLLNSLHNDLGNYLTREELETIALHAEQIAFNPGEVILQQGKYAEGIYLVIQGTVIVTAKILGEGITSLETLEHGNFLGDLSFIENIPCTTSMTANNEVQCIFLTKTYIEFLAAYHPEIKYHLFNAICRQVCARINQVYTKITKFISSAGMTPRPILGEFIHSLTKPAEASVEDAAIDINRLHHLSLFKTFTDEEVAQLLEHAIILKAPKNCTLIRKGEVSADSYIVIQGAVQSSITHENKVAKLSVIGPETLFTSIACADKSLSYTITFTTCEPCILLKLSNEHLTFVQENHPTIWYKLFDLMCRSIVALEKSVDKLDIRLNIETYNR